MDLKPMPSSKSEILKEAYELGILSKFNFQVSNHLAFQLPRGKLLKACYNSKKSLRSFTKVSIILLGVSGVGKSCTINHLLSLAIARTSEDSSETRSTTCYSIKEKIQSLGVSNFLVDLIDTPGLSDGEGLKQDAANFKSISNYCISEFSEKIFPNIIFLFLQSNDNRYNHERSKFVLSLKQIKKLNIVCQEFPNVVVIITFACSIAFGDVEKWKEKLNQISSKIKHLVSKHLGIDSLVVWLENDYEFCGLTVSNDNNSSFLPDGTIQPANLYKAIVEQARKNNDELLENAMHHLFSNSLIRRVEVFVRITIKAKDTRLEKLDEKENKILMEMQTDQGGYVPEKIIPPAHIYMCVGAGLNILSDELKPSRLFEVDENDTYNSFGIQLPKGFQLVFVNETRKFSEYSKNQTEYVKKRLACLHFDANVDLSLFKMKTRAGFVYSSNLSNEKNSINHSLLQEVRLFKVEIKESTELKLTNEFKKHVNLLPDKYNRYDSSNKSLYQSFFNRWGHFIVSSAYGGGSVEISQFTEDAKNFEESSTSSQFLLETSFDVLSGGDVLSDCGSNFSDSTRFSNISLKWNGGDSKFHILNFGESDLSSKWSRWRESLKTNPSILTTEMSLAYIYEYVGLVNQSKVQGCKNALNDILGIRDSIPETLSSNLKNYRTVSEDMSLVTIKPTVSKDISTVTNRQKIVEGEIAKSDDPKCFPEKALVYVKGHNSPITLNKLKVRDEALSFDTNSQQLVYSPVYMFGHKDGSIITTFIYIQTSNGFSVTLSAKHMIMVENISNIDVKFADQVLVGDTLLQIETKDNKMIIVKEKVTKISNVISKGIYSPFTKTGTIIVDSTLVSCYAHVSNLDRFGLFRISGQKLAHSFLAPFRVFYDFGIIRPMEISIGQTMPFNIEVALEKFRSFLKF